MNGCLSYQVQYLRENETLCCVRFKWNDAYAKCLRKYSNYIVLFIFFKPAYSDQMSFICYSDNNLFIKTIILPRDSEMGYFEIYCSLKCPFPGNGVKCMSNCNCSGADCDHVYGCVMSKKVWNTLLLFLISNWLHIYYLLFIST